VKLIIQIPCFNEEETLPLVFEKMPREIPGVSAIEYQIIDDGSTDRTVEIAKSLGVQHIVSMPGKNRRWLGRAFQAGVENALKQGADILVNTDGDNQYPSERIPDLVAPLLAGKVDLVIGDRNPGSVEEFSPVKRWLQRLGSWVIQVLTKEPVKDAVSGFRAYSREALLQINIITNFTYTVDTLIQAHEKGLDVEWLPITPNKKTRDSRLISSLWQKVQRSGMTILRLSTVYQPFRTFFVIGTMFLVPGVAFLLRFLFLFFFVEGEADGHVQSIIAGAILTIVGVQMYVLGILADLSAVNRRLIEEGLTRVRRQSLENKDSKRT